MIAKGRFNAQLARIARVLKLLDLLEEAQANPNKSLGAAHFRGMSYRQVYEECIREYAYDFRLVDQSLLLFIKGGHDAHDGTLSFSFTECPVDVMPYRDFVASAVGITPDDTSFAETLADWGDALRSDYGDYVTSEDSKAIATPLRACFKKHFSPSFG